MRNPLANQRCWLIAEHNGAAPTLAAQFAHLRGCEVRTTSSAKVPEFTQPLIAMSFAMLDAIPARERESLRASIQSGATLYVRGAASDGSRHNLSPLLEASFAVGRMPGSAGYRFTRHAMIPGALRGEEGRAPDGVCCVSDMRGSAEPILMALAASGAEMPIAFAYRVGRGAIICDVQPDDPNIDTPLIWRMADPVQRCIAASALIAADCAAERNLDAPVAFNLTIDDVPLAYDYFNEPLLEAFFGHMASRCAKAHLDCAWIPTSHWISRRYVEILKTHGVGFLWHGIHRHVDHQKMDDAVAEMAAGKRAMAANMERYGVRLQSMIIFPFERADRRSEALLLKEGFIGGAEQPHCDQGDGAIPGYLRFSDGGCLHQSGMHFLHRYEAEFLTRDRMLAIAALGMPILAFAHPKDLGLKRLARFADRGGAFSHFDHVLDFASAKSLSGGSLEEIAQGQFQQRSESAATEALPAQDSDQGTHRRIA